MSDRECIPLYCNSTTWVCNWNYVNKWLGLEKVEKFEKMLWWFVDINNSRPILFVATVHRISYLIEDQDITREQVNVANSSARLGDIGIVMNDFLFQIQERRHALPTQSSRSIAQCKFQHRFKTKNRNSRSNWIRLAANNVTSVGWTVSHQLH